LYISPLYDWQRIITIIIIMYELHNWTSDSVNKYKIMLQTCYKLTNVHEE